MDLRTRIEGTIAIAMTYGVFLYGKELTRDEPFSLFWAVAFGVLAFWVVIARRKNREK